MENNDNKQITPDTLELYVAGALPEEQMRQITQLVRSSPELKAEVEKLEAAFVAYAALHAPDVSDKTKETIEEIGRQERQSPPAVEKTDAKVREIGAARNRWYLIAAAILLLISLSFNISQYLQLKRANQDLLAFQFEREQYVQNYDALKARYDLTQEQFRDIRRPGTKAIILSGTKAAPNAEVIAYWNPENQSVYVDAADLPAPPEGQVYQLWWLSSLDPLTPHDAGLLDSFETNEQKLFAAGKTIGPAVAFAITLEPAGGSTAPTLEQLYVLGTV